MEYEGMGRDGSCGKVLMAAFCVIEEILIPLKLSDYNRRFSKDASR